MKRGIRNARSVSARPAVLLACAFLAVFSASGAQAGDRLLVFAAASLKDGLDDIATLWREAGRGEAAISYAGTSSLAKQIEAGAPADILFAADDAWMTYLEDRALVRPESRGHVVTNALVAIVGGGAFPGAVPPVAQVLIGADRIAVADTEAVPAGRYARAALISLGLWDRVRGKLVQTENVRMALALVARREVPVGIVYRSDATAESRVTILTTFPPETHPPIAYPAAVLVSSRHRDAAAFLDFARSADTRAVWVRHGFGVPPPTGGHPAP